MKLWRMHLIAKVCGNFPPYKSISNLFLVYLRLVPYNWFICNNNTHAHTFALIDNRKHDEWKMVQVHAKLCFLFAKHDPQFYCSVYLTKSIVFAWYAPKKMLEEKKNNLKCINTQWKKCVGNFPPKSISCLLFHIFGKVEKWNFCIWAGYS